MAVSTYYSPLPTEIADPVTYKEAVALFARTGHKASESTLRRYVADDGITTARVGRIDYMSWSDLLEAHFKRTAAKLRSSSNWP